MVSIANAVPGDDRSASDAGRVARELQRLDRWTYWVVPAPAEESGDLIVVGVTGAFLLMALSTEGYADTTGRALKIEGKRVGGLSALRRSARRLRGRLAAAAVFAEVEPVVCLTRALAGAPRTIGRVRVVPISALVRDITERQKVLGPSRARRAAESLGFEAGKQPDPEESG